MMMNPMECPCMMNDIRWNNMIRWLDGTLQDLDEGSSNIVVRTQLEGQGAIVSSPVRYVKASAPANWMEV
jgi:hypothetical protein